MRKSLESLIRQTIVHKYSLPNKQLNIDRTLFSTCDDSCLTVLNDNDLSEIIYNSVIEYAFNEFEMEESDYADLHTIAFEERIRFRETADEATKLKYGFYGEVILYAILKVMYGANTLISKGHFYSPIENSEAKGYDAYHLIESGNKVELWFGESKFHINYTSALKDVIEKMDISLSDQYLKRNLLAIRQAKTNINAKGSKLDEILNKWWKKPTINIFEELNTNSIEFVYPVIILFQQNNEGYDSSIEQIPKYISKKYKPSKFNISIPYSIYFIFIPVGSVKLIKSQVLAWIKSKKPLMS